MRWRCLSLLAVATVCLPVLASSPVEPLTDDAVIATVNGDPVKYADVKVNAEIVVVRFRRMHGRDPETNTDRDAIERDKRDLEIAKLAISIRAAVRRQQIARFEIDPTEEEIEERWQRYRREREAEGELIDVGVMFEQGREKLRQLLNALEEVLDRDQDPEAVYERRLADKMSRKEWKLRLKYEGTPEKRKQLERLLDLPDDELFKPREAMRSVLIMDRLTEGVEEDLVRTDPEFAEYVRLAATNPADQKVQSKGPNHRAAKRYEWWQQRYREAKVEIKDERFKDAWKEPFE